jgi:hypothetical protein
MMEYINSYNDYRPRPLLPLYNPAVLFARQEVDDETPIEDALIQRQLYRNSKRGLDNTLNNFGDTLDKIKKPVTEHADEVEDQEGRSNLID